MFNPLTIVTLATILAVVHGLYIILYKREIVWKDKYDKQTTHISLRGRPAITFAIIYICGAISILVATTIFSPHLQSPLNYLFLPSCIGGLVLWAVALAYAYKYNDNKMNRKS